jgi:hypothetical protein
MSAIADIRIAVLCIACGKRSRMAYEHNPECTDVRGAISRIVDDLVGKLHRNKDKSGDARSVTDFRSHAIVMEKVANILQAYGDLDDALQHCQESPALLRNCINDVCEHADKAFDSSKLNEALKSLQDTLVEKQTDISPEVDFIASDGTIQAASVAHTGVCTSILPDSGSTRIDLAPATSLTIWPNAGCVVKISVEAYPQQG